MTACGDSRLTGLHRCSSAISSTATCTAFSLMAFTIVGWSTSNARRAICPLTRCLVMGHGQPVAGPAILEWQTNYIRRFLDVLRMAVEHDGLQGDALKATVTAEMKNVLPTDDLLFL